MGAILDRITQTNQGKSIATATPAAIIEKKFDTTPVFAETDQQRDDRLAYTVFYIEAAINANAGKIQTVEHSGVVEKKELVFFAFDQLLRAKAAEIGQAVDPYVTDQTDNNRLAYQLFHPFFEEAQSTALEDQILKSTLETKQYSYTSMLSYFIGHNPDEACQSLADIPDSYRYGDIPFRIINSGDIVPPSSGDLEAARTLYGQNQLVTSLSTPKPSTSEN
jgi:hypothetical protein